VDQTLIATETLERGTKCRARDHRIKVDVERAELGTFRNVQTEIIVASCPYTLGEEADTDAHKHSRVGIEQRFAIDALCLQERDRIVAQRHETRHQRAQGTNGQPRLAMSHVSTSPQVGWWSPAANRPAAIAPSHAVRMSQGRKLLTDEFHWLSQAAGVGSGRAHAWSRRLSQTLRKIERLAASWQAPARQHRCASTYAKSQ
jgi:hypothetical protein